jgi:hypothetical protein
VYILSEARRAVSHLCRFPLVGMCNSVDLKLFTHVAHKAVLSLFLWLPGVDKHNCYPLRSGLVHASPNLLALISTVLAVQLTTLARRLHLIRLFRQHTEQKPLTHKALTV